MWYSFHKFGPFRKLSHSQTVLAPTLQAQPIPDYTLPPQTLSPGLSHDGVSNSLRNDTTSAHKKINFPKVSPAKDTQGANALSRKRYLPG